MSLSISRGVLGQLGVDDTYVLSLSENPLPLWDEGLWSGDEKWSTVWKPIARELRSSMNWS